MPTEAIFHCSSTLFIGVGGLSQSQSSHTVWQANLLWGIPLCLLKLELQASSHKAFTRVLCLRKFWGSSCLHNMHFNH